MTCTISMLWTLIRGWTTTHTLYELREKQTKINKQNKIRMWKGVHGLTFLKSNFYFVRTSSEPIANTVSSMSLWNCSLRASLFEQASLPIFETASLTWLIVLLRCFRTSMWDRGFLTVLLLDLHVMCLMLEERYMHKWLNIDLSYPCVASHSSSISLCVCVCVCVCVCMCVRERRYA